MAVVPSDQALPKPTTMVLSGSSSHRRHFGGEAPREDGRLLRGYRRNVRDLERGGDRVVR
jgi:hypothetical protein